MCDRNKTAGVNSRFEMSISSTVLLASGQIEQSQINQWLTSKKVTNQSKFSYSLRTVPTEMSSCLTPSQSVYPPLPRLEGLMSEKHVI